MIYVYMLLLYIAYRLYKNNKKYDDIISKKKEDDTPQTDESGDVPEIKDDNGDVDYSEMMAESNDNGFLTKLYLSIIKPFANPLLKNYDEDMKKYRAERDRITNELADTINSSPEASEWFAKLFKDAVITEVEKQGYTYIPDDDTTTKADIIIKNTDVTYLTGPHATKDPEKEK